MKTANILIILSVVFFPSGCTNNRTLVARSTLRTDLCIGVYLSGWYNYKFREDKVKQKDGNFSFIKVKTDSTLILQGYKFFTNGVYRFVESQKTIDTVFIMKALNSRSLDRSNWGVYELKGDSVFMKGWAPSEGSPVYEKVGIISNGKKMEMIKRRCVSCGKLDSGSKWHQHSKILDFYNVRVVTDSVFALITDSLGNPIGGQSPN